MTIGITLRELVRIDVLIFFLTLYFSKAFQTPRHKEYVNFMGRMVWLSKKQCSLSHFILYTLCSTYDRKKPLKNWYTEYTSALTLRFLEMFTWPVVNMNK